MAGPPAAFNALAATVGWAQEILADGGNLSPQLAVNLGRARTCMATYAAQLFVERGRSGGGGDGGNGKSTRSQAALAAAAATADARVAATACEVLCVLAVLSDDAGLAAAEWDAAPCIVAILKLFGGIPHVSTATACELLEQATAALPALLAAHSKSREAISGGGGSANIAAAAAQLLPRLQPASRRRLTPLVQRVTDASQPAGSRPANDVASDTWDLEQQLATSEGAAPADRGGAGAEEGAAKPGGFSF